jgi:hypothetical protein
MIQFCVNKAEGFKEGRRLTAGGQESFGKQREQREHFLSISSSTSSV